MSQDDDDRFYRLGAFLGVLTTIGVLLLLGVLP